MYDDTYLYVTIYWLYVTYISTSERQKQDDQTRQQASKCSDRQLNWAIDMPR
jgi:hypothetical protein